MPAPKENEGFLDGSVKKDAADAPDSPLNSCCKSKATLICFIILGVIGGLLVLLGIAVAIKGPDRIEAKIIDSMALAEGSDRVDSWLKPPVTPHLYGYAFNVTNAADVLSRGAKPIVKEVGPYVYSSATVKDSDDNMRFYDDDGTLEYRPRKLYVFEPKLTGPGLDPFKDVVTVPNIPLWTGLHSIRDKDGFAKDIGRSLIAGSGLGTPFISVTFDGLLWGYEDELPCLSLDRPSGCAAASGEEASPFDDSEDDWGDDDDWGGRRKRSAAEPGRDFSDINDDPNSEYYGQAKPKAEFVDCKCNWGLFRDRNVTMRKPTRFLTGVTDLTKKGWVTEFDGSSELGWWKKGSTCDKPNGFDGSTLPPLVKKENKYNMFISLMCRSMPLQYEQEVEHGGITTYRFIPPVNAFGSHNDPNDTMVNPVNKCFCLEDEGYRCFKSGVLNMEPCKRASKAPLALSMPHFYNADPSFGEALEGLSPDKSKHEFFVDLVPKFGFPLSIRPRFQLNIVIGKSVDPAWPVIANMPEEIVMPFLWAQDGFEDPPQDMIDQVEFGLNAHKKVATMLAVVLFVLGGLLLLSCLGFLIWSKKSKARDSKTPDVIHS